MQDISQGKGRNRAWPRKRGKAKTEEERLRQLKFTGCQLAARYISPQQMCDIINGRKGTPILPRDCVTSMLMNRLAAFTLPNGRVWYPMPAYENVTQCLDTVSQEPGDILIRGSNGWEAIPYVTPSSISGPATFYRNAAAANATGDGTWWIHAYDTTSVAASFASLNAGTGAVTINEDGWYQIDIHAQWNGSAAGDFSAIELLVGGVSQAFQGIDIVNCPYFWPRLQWIMHLTAGQVITAQSRVGGTTKVYDLVTGAGSTFIRLVRLG